MRTVEFGGQEWVKRNELKDRFPWRADTRGGSRECEAHHQFSPDEDRETITCSFPLQDIFRSHPVIRSHDHEFSMCWDHDAVYHACWQIDFANHRRFPDVGLVQFRPSPKLG